MKLLNPNNNIDHLKVAKCMHNGLHNTCFCGDPPLADDVGVLFIPNIGQSQEDMYSYMSYLRHIPTATFDLRGHGKSEGKFGCTQHIDDIVFMTQEMQKQNRRVAIVGFGLSGTCVLKTRGFADLRVAVDPVWHPDHLPDVLKKKRWFPKKYGHTYIDKKMHQRLGEQIYQIDLGPRRHVIGQEHLAFENFHAYENTNEVAGILRHVLLNNL